MSVSTQLRTPTRPTNEPMNAPRTAAILFLTSLIQYARKSATGTERRKPKTAPMKMGSPGLIMSDGKKLDMIAILPSDNSYYILLQPYAIADDLVHMQVYHMHSYHVCV